MTKRKKELKKIRKAKLKKIKQMKKTLKEFFSFANSFGQVGGLGQDHVFVGFSHGDLMELKYSEEEYFTPKNIPGVSYFPEENMFAWYTQANTGYRKEWYPSERKIVVRNCHNSEGFFDKEILVEETNPEKFFAEYISALKELKKALKTLN